MKRLIIYYLSSRLDHVIKEPISESIVLLKLLPTLHSISHKPYLLLSQSKKEVFYHRLLDLFEELRLPGGQHNQYLKICIITLWLDKKQEEVIPTVCCLKKVLILALDFSVLQL